MESSKATFFPFHDTLQAYFCCGRPGLKLVALQWPMIGPETASCLARVW